MQADILLMRHVPPSPESNKRHKTEQEHLARNPHLSREQVGTTHIGNWHIVGHPRGPIYETSDLRVLSSEGRELYFQYLSNCNDVMTRGLDLWFGIFDPVQREDYRCIYRGIPEDVRLPPSNEDYDEIYSLRGLVCNRPTDERPDQDDVKGGLTGLVQL